MPNGHDPYAALRSPRLSSDADRQRSRRAAAPECSSWPSIGRSTSEPSPKAALGFVGLFQFFPVLLLSIPVGHLADRISRKWLFVFAQAILAAASAGLVRSFPISRRRSFGSYPILIVIGVGRAFSAPARWALLPQIVPPEALGNAVTWNSSGWQVATVVGPALGGFVICDRPATRPGPMRRPPPATSIGVVARCPPSGRGRCERVDRAVVAGHLLAGLAVRLEHAADSGDDHARPVRRAARRGDGPAAGLRPDILHVGRQRAWAGCGRRHRSGRWSWPWSWPTGRRCGGPGPALLLSVAGFGVATIVFGLSENLMLSFAMLAITGALDNVSIVVRGTLVQLLTPDAMRGRVSAVNTIFIVSSNELGAFESGMTASWFRPGRVGRRRRHRHARWSWLGDGQVAAGAAARPAQQPDRPALHRDGRGGDRGRAT